MAGRNAIVTSLIVCCGYVICWSPNEIYFFLNYAGYAIDFAGWMYHFTWLLVLDFLGHWSRVAPAYLLTYFRWEPGGYVSETGNICHETLYHVIFLVFPVSPELQGYSTGGRHCSVLTYLLTDFLLYLLVCRSYELHTVSWLYHFISKQLLYDTASDLNLLANGTFSVECVYFPFHQSVSCPYE